MTTLTLGLWKQRQKQDGTHSIVFILRQGRKRKIKATGYFSTPSQWGGDNVNARKHPQGKKLQLKLNSMLSQKCELLDRLMFHDLTFEQLGNRLFSDNHDNGLVKYMSQRADIMDSQKRTGNARIYRIVAKQVENEIGNIPLDHLNYDVLARFRDKKLSDGLNPNSVHLYLRTIRACVNEAIREGLMSNYPFKRGLMPTLQPTRHRNIEVNDMIKLLDYKPTKQREQRALDAYLLGFFLRGMDIVDVSHLTKMNLRDDYIEYRRKKSKTLLTVKIASEARDIIEKYNGQHEEFLLPLLHERIDDNRENYDTRIKNLNRALKDVGKSLGIQGLTYKTNRHSFGSMAKHAGISKDMIKEMLGHTDGMVTEVYLADYPQDEIDKAHQQVIDHLWREKRKAESQNASPNKLEEPQTLYLPAA
jgi:integrase